LLLALDLWELGAAFVAVGVDTTVLMRGLRELAGKFKGTVIVPSTGVVSTEASGWMAPALPVFAAKAAPTGTAP